MGQDGSGRKSAGLLPQLSSELPITEWLFGLSSLRFLVFPVCINRTNGFGNLALWWWWWLVFGFLVGVKGKEEHKICDIYRNVLAFREEIGNFVLFI